ncbi:MAG: hypothetical protein AMXMBFR84_11790 [Candidatus Hydrogenedentota bacterium]
MIKRIASVMIVVSMSASAQEWVDFTPSTGLAGWTVFEGAWKSEEGEFTGQAESGNEAAIVFDREFADFEWEMEILAPAAGAAEIVFRGHRLPILPVVQPSEGEVPMGVYGYSIGVTAEEDAVSIAFVDRLRKGELVKARKAAIAEFKSGEWNRVAISAQGESIAVTINGTPALSGESSTYSKGILALTTSSEIRVRGMRVKDKDRVGEWQPLFNGQNFDGWQVWGTEEWVVENSEIIGRSGPAKSEGYLSTLQTWKDFHVRGSFKTLGEGNYGLFFHSTIAYDDKNYPVITGIQGEVEPGYPGSSGWLYESYKRGWLVEPDKATLPAYALRVGEWNEIEIMSKGNRMVTWVNGVNVMDWRDPAPNVVEGSFALQLHAGGVDGIMWKDIYVKK